MSATFSKSDRQFLKSIGVGIDSTFDDVRMDLAQRIAKHTAPVQVKVSSQAARLELVRLSLQKLLDAPEDTEQ